METATKNPIKEDQKASESTATAVSPTSPNAVVDPSLNLESITDGANESGIPLVKFIEDITAFSESFHPTASAELLIGAFSDLFGKFKNYETSLVQKKHLYQQKIPEVEKSLALVKYLQSKKQQLDDGDEGGDKVIARYNLADLLYQRAEVDVSAGIVHLWLGANVMLEYTYEEAIELLSSKLKIATKELNQATADLAFTRNQIITAEVNISRIYNWDVRRKRLAKKQSELNGGTQEPKS